MEIKPGKKIYEADYMICTKECIVEEHEITMVNNDTVEISEHLITINNGSVEFSEQEMYNFTTPSWIEEIYGETPEEAVRKRLKKVEGYAEAWEQEADAYRKWLEEHKENEDD